VKEVRGEGCSGVVSHGYALGRCFFILGYVEKYTVAGKPGARGFGGFSFAIARFWKKFLTARSICVEAGV